MTDKNLFNEDWLKLQRDYWESLTNMGRKALGMEGSQGNAWQAALDQWWRTLSPGASDPARQFMDRLIDQGKTFFRFGEQFARGGDGGGNAWDIWNRTLGDMQRAFAGGSSGGAGDPGDALRKMMGFWEMPLDNWQRMMSSLSPMMPGDWLRNMPHDAMREPMDRLLSAPGLGYTREEQGQYQDLMRRAMDYQRALQEYSGFFSQLGGKSVARMQSFIKSQADAGKTIDSARALYDSWVACCEDVYAEEVRSPEYSRINGQLVNSLMALKARMAVMVDENLGAMNMPTRTELRTLQDRLQETRRENRKLRHEMDMIQRRLAALPAGPTSMAQAALAAPATARPATPRKKAVAKSDAAE